MADVKKKFLQSFGPVEKTNKSLLARFNVMLGFTQAYNYVLNVSTGGLGSSVTKTLADVRI